MGESRPNRTRWSAAAPAALAIAVPAATLLLAKAFTTSDRQGLFQAMLASMVLSSGVGAFLVRRLSHALPWIPAGAVLAGLAGWVVGASFGGASALALLSLAVGWAATGLAALGRRVGAPVFTSSAIGACLVWVAMAGLFWADPVAELLPPAARRPFRQAVLHVDPATALAYDGAALDRLRTPDVYFDVPLASSMMEAPGAVPTALLWIAVGGLGLGLARILPPADGGEPK